MTAAVERLRTADYDRAIHLFDAVLAQRPTDADALHLKGVAWDYKGEALRAIDLIGQALALREDAAYRSNFGVALSHAGRHAEAVEEYRRAVAARPDYPEAHNNLGVSLQALRRSAEAEIAYRAAIAARADYAEAYGNLGNTLRALNRDAEAITAYEQAIALNPAHRRAPLGYALRAMGRSEAAEAAFREDVARHPDSPEALNNLAAALGETERIEEAAEILPRVTALRPEFPEAHANLGQVFQQLGRMEEAVAACKRAVALRPNYPEALTNLGNALRVLERFDEAEQAVRRAVALRPTEVSFYNNLAIVLMATDRPHEALAVLDLAVALDPDDPETRHHRAMTLLRLGRLAEGWEDYEWRFRIKQSGDAYRQFADNPPWAGEPLVGRSILLHPEQGLGDTIQFARFASVLVAMGARVVLGAQKPLARLLRSIPGLHACVPVGEVAPATDVHCPLMSLPRALGTRLETLPAVTPYLFADATDASRWRERLGVGRPGLRVGIAWAGNPKHLGDRQRSIALSAFAPLWRVPGVRWFALQVGERAADMAALHDAIRPAGGIDPLGTEFADLADTAAAMQSLDLVISVDTSVAHLAGATGRQVWTLLPLAADWRWLRDIGSSPWYPTMRLFRQDRSRCWKPVLEQVAEELAQFAQANRSWAIRADEET